MLVRLGMKERFLRRRDWRPRFAWHPIRINDHLIWLERYEERLDGTHNEDRLRRHKKAGAERVVTEEGLG